MVTSVTGLEMGKKWWLESRQQSTSAAGSLLKIINNLPITWNCLHYNTCSRKSHYSLHASILIHLRDVVGFKSVLDGIKDRNATFCPN